MPEVGLIKDPSVAKAESQFVRDEAGFFKWIYKGRIKNDAHALQVGSDFVDRLKVEHPKEYKLGVKTGDLYNEMRHIIPDETRFGEMWKEFYAIHTQIDLADIGKKLFKKSPERKWQEAAEKLSLDLQYQDITADTWVKIVKFATSAEELKQKLRDLNLEPEIK